MPLITISSHQLRRISGAHLGPLCSPAHTNTVALGAAVPNTRVDLHANALCIQRKSAQIRFRAWSRFHGATALRYIVIAALHPRWERARAVWRMSAAGRSPLRSPDTTCPRSRVVGTSWISLLTRSMGFGDQIWRQCLAGKPANARTFSPAPPIIAATFGWDLARIHVISPKWMFTCPVSGFQYTPVGTSAVELPHPGKLPTRPKTRKFTGDTAPQRESMAKSHAHRLTRNRS